MPERTHQYLADRGLSGRYSLSAYVLTKHLRSLGIEFDWDQTALDLASTGYRVWRAAEHAVRDLFHHRPGSYENHFDQHLAWEIGNSPHYRLAICDRDRLADYLESLEGEDRQRLAAWAMSYDKAREKIPKLKTLDDVDQFRKVLMDKLVAIAKERVKVTVISKGRVIAMAQATGVEGAPMEVRRYKGGTDVNGVSLGECTLQMKGLMIIRKLTGIPKAEKVTTVENELTGHIVKLTATQDTTPKGEEREVKTVAKDATLTLTGKDHRRSWIVSVEDEPEETDG